MLSSTFQAQALYSVQFQTRIHNQLLKSGTDKFTCNRICKLFFPYTCSCRVRTLLYKYQIQLPWNLFPSDISDIHFEVQLYVLYLRGTVLLFDCSLQHKKCIVCLEWLKVAIYSRSIANSLIIRVWPPFSIAILNFSVLFLQQIHLSPLSPSKPTQRWVVIHSC
jgi:hypothetical protein